MIYVFNSLIVPINFDKHKNIKIILKKVTKEEAREMLKNGHFTSAIGHEGAAQLLTEILGINIPVNRVSVFLEPGDRGLHFFLKQRLPEGKVLSKEELEKLEFWLVVSSIETLGDENGLG